MKVDDKPTEGINHNELVRMIQGEPGSKITLTVLHEGSRQPETLTMNRAIIEVKTVLGLHRLEDNPKEFEWFADRAAGIGYIRIVQFTEHTADDLKKTLERLQAEGMKSLILDLRDNPGGLLKSAVAVSDFFLKEGTIVSIRDRNGNGKTETAKAEGTLLEPAAAHPMVILVNRMSASASEIVSAALQDNHRAVVIGERSFGKGSVQRIISLNTQPPTALKLTTDTYWRPSGVNMHRYPDSKESDEWGVRPNSGFEIPMKDEERLEYLRYKRNKDIVRKDKKEPEKPYVDKAMVKAVEYLKPEANK
jgi:carboxyl-terminal processing protease